MCRRGFAPSLSRSLKIHPTLQMPGPRAYPLVLRSCFQSSSPDPKTAFPVGHTKATPRESAGTAPDTPIPAPPAPHSRPPPSPSAPPSPPFPPSPQSQPVSTSPCPPLTSLVCARLPFPSRILNQRRHALYCRRPGIDAYL